MRRILRTTWLTICLVVIAVCLVSCFSFCIPPSTFHFISVLSLIFPYILALAFFCGVTLLFFNKKAGFILLPLMAVCAIKNTGNTIALGFGGWKMPAANTSLRVMTWNIEGFAYLAPKKKEGILNAIATYKPDILCLQEATNIEYPKRKLSLKRQMDSLGYIYSFLPGDTVFTEVHKSGKVSTTSRGVAIFSRLPLIDSGKIFLDDWQMPKNLIYADVLLGQKTVRVFTAHLASYVYSKPGKHTKVIEDETYTIPHTNKKLSIATITGTELQHEKEVAIIRGQIDKSPNPVVYCGDINATPASYTYNTLKANMQDVFLQKGSGIGATYYGFLKTLRIDVCLADKKLKTLQCVVPDQRFSDHLPVIADLTWK